MDKERNLLLKKPLKDIRNKGKRNKWEICKVKKYRGLEKEEYCETFVPRNFRDLEKLLLDACYDFVQTSDGNVTTSDIWVLQV